MRRIVISFIMMFLSGISFAQVSDKNTGCFFDDNHKTTFVDTVPAGNSVYGSLSVLIRCKGDYSYLITPQKDFYEIINENKEKLTIRFYQNSSYTMAFSNGTPIAGSGYSKIINIYYVISGSGKYKDLKGNAAIINSFKMNNNIGLNINYQ